MPSPIKSFHPPRQQQLRLETARSTALVIDREDIDVIGTNYEVGPVRKPTHADATDATVVNGKDLGLPVESIKASIDGAQKEISESSPSRLVSGVGLVDVEFGA